MKNYCFKQTLIHTLISATTLGIAYFLTFKIWYQPPLQLALPVIDIFKLVAAGTLILGPVLTLAFCTPGKPNLRRDMTTIASIQIIAFIYGMWVIAEGRPAWIVFNIDRFDIVRVNEIDNRNKKDALDSYRTPSWLGPQWVSAPFPTDPDKQEKILFEAIFAGIDIQHRPELYRPLEMQMDLILKSALPLDNLSKTNPTASTLKTLSYWPDADAWLPVAAQKKSFTALIDTKRKKIVTIVDLYPWSD